MRCLSIIKDHRINATSVLTQMSIGDYLRLVSGAESNLEIQRKIIKGFKPYERLRDDLEIGCIIPPLVIGVKDECVITPLEEDMESQEHFLQSIASLDPDNVYIIDGLQRTRAIQDVYNRIPEDDAKNKFLSQQVRVEIWPDITLSALTYRMILLNAGQKPMSLKHQLEIVSSPLCKNLREKFGDEISIYTEKNSDRRSGAGQYQFSIIASSFQSFVQKKPHVDIRNDVIAELNQIDVLEKYGQSLDDSYDTPDLTKSFEEYIDYLIELDKKLCSRYQSNEEVDDGRIKIKIPSGVNLLTRETVHLALSAAYGFCLEYCPEQLQQGKAALLALLDDDSNSDPLSLYSFEKIQTGFSRRDNTGEKTREFIFKGFKEYFRSAGTISINDCWIQADL
ncbi:ParB N-terminal domain-containing protein [Aeromonas veronii]|uniref:hypothetical protein n=1 Tax=Aeromonas veronii TaxID=654 RepID=UPI002B47AFAD|nr:hypothetical protein [Aeromonas veronii]